MYMNVHQLRSNAGTRKVSTAVQGRVVNKTQVRHFSNNRGEGKFFNFDLLDSSGCDVRIVGFNEAVDKFFDVVQKGQIVKVSKATAKPKRNVRWC